MLALLLLALVPLGQTTPASQEAMSEDEVRAFLGWATQHAIRDLAHAKPMPDISWHLNQLFPGTKIPLDFEVKVASLTGPISFDLAMPMRGEKQRSGSVYAEANVVLDRFQVEMPYFYINIFGFTYKTTAQMSLINTQVKVGLRLTKGAAASYLPGSSACMAQASVMLPASSAPYINFGLGKTGSLMYWVSRTLFGLANMYTGIVDDMKDLFIPDIQNIIAQSLEAQVCNK